MKREDFKTAQTVWVYLTGNAVRRTNKDNLIQEWEVVSVGRKYLTIKPKNGLGWEERFDIQRNFRNVNDTCVNYILFLSKEDVEEYIWRNETVRYIQKLASSFGSPLSQMSVDELKTVYDIFRKYDKSEGDK